MKLLVLVIRFPVVFIAASLAWGTFAREVTEGTAGIFPSTYVFYTHYRLKVNRGGFGIVARRYGSEGI